MSAVTGCQSFGYEIIKERHDLAILMLKDYDEILESAGLGRFCVGNLVHLVCGDFKDTSIDHNTVKLVYACNFGPHYSSCAKTKSGDKLPIDYNMILYDFMMEMPQGARFVCLETVTSKRNNKKYHCSQSLYGGFNWLGSCSTKIPIYEYNIN